MSGLIEAAEKAREAGMYQLALGLYREHLKASAQDAEALSAAAYCLHQLNQKSEAREMNEAALRLNKNLPLSHVVEAFLSSDDGDSARAVQEAELALQAAPSSSEALACRGIFALEDGDPQEARVYLEKAIASNPRMYLAHYNLIACYQRLGDEKSANAEITALLKLKRNPWNLLRFLVSRVMGNRVVLATFMLAPLLVLITHAKILFAFHLFLIILYAGSALLAIRQKQPALVRRNFTMAAVLAIADVVIVAILS